jgi:membrane-bound ClpP family serine protease
MPFAVALLCHPLGALASLVAAIAAVLYAAQSRRFVPVFTAVSASLLTLLAFLQVRPSASGLTALCAGVAVLHLEFLWPTFGVAAILGIAATACGSYLLLAALDPVTRCAAAFVSTLAVLAAVTRTMRLRTLPP